MYTMHTTNELNIFLPNLLKPFAIQSQEVILITSNHSMLKCTLQNAIVYFIIVFILK